MYSLYCLLIVSCLLISLARFSWNTYWTITQADSKFQDDVQILRVKHEMFPRAWTE